MTTWDPATVTAVTLSGGNLVATNTGTTSANQGAKVESASGKSSGKYYFETTWTTINQAGGNFGIGIGTTVSTYTNMGNGGTTGDICYRGGGDVWSNGSQILVGGGNWSAGQIAGIAVDLDNRRIWFRASPSGIWNNSGTANPATNVGGLVIPAGTMVPFVTFGGSGGAANNVMTANFGATTFSGAAPSGFVSGWGVQTPVLLPAAVASDDNFPVPAVASSASLLPALVIDNDAFSAPAISTSVLLLSALFSDTDAFYVPGIANTSQFLQSAAVTDADTILVAALGSSALLLATLHAADDAFFSASVISGSVTLSAALIADTDAFYAPSIVAQQIPGQVLQPGLVAADDVIVTTSVSGRNALQPALLIDPDDIATVDAGWRLFGQLLVDVDLVLSPRAKTLAYLLPNVFQDGETIDTYPFFIQNVSGGIPVPPPSGVLTGSISYPRRVLHGTVNRQPNLTGSVKSSTRVLTGSIKR